MPSSKINSTSKMTESVDVSTQTDFSGHTKLRNSKAFFSLGLSARELKLRDALRAADLDTMKPTFPPPDSKKLTNAKNDTKEVSCCYKKF